MNDSTGAAAYVGQLAERVAELVPEMGTPERLDLLGVMDPDDLRTSLAFIASMYPQVFDFALVRDRAMTERLVDQLDDLEPYCKTCGELIGLFIGYEGWHHYRGDGTPESRTELYDAGHAPAVARRTMPARPRTDAMPAASRRDQRAAALAIRMSRKDDAR